MACQADTEEEEEPGDEAAQLWSHSINFPEKGCLLVAHPLMFTTQQMYFSQVALSLPALPLIVLKNHGLLFFMPLNTLYTPGDSRGLEAQG